MFLLIDNYDSFAYNLYQLVGSFVPDIMVARNDAVTADEVEALAPEAIFLSPGPGRPENAGVCPALVRRFAGKIPIFGVCLGMQVICSALGGRVSYAKTLMHGKVSRISLEGESVLFKGLESGFPAARYHSLAAVEKSLPPALKVTARAGDGEIMALEDVKRLVCGVQFHPESVMTPDGPAMVKNFIDAVKAGRK
ncbi:aminodeoxychorismate/anthranilate synthase component II [Cloacibacillus sp. An23]|uniref:anthranilate synthase component II n=1 Tax=Cloacibacillus sp. An23 TaxID=1965591 RepID=UPI000B3A732B|nr:aminodeoxychorismate/anthranilate synthase component II [Cloacibacillus sp. An23]OUO94625.1 aminodeoxychorismate/anthranilate synthase component II [Cloacibacillus sp. An23]